MSISWQKIVEENLNLAHAAFHKYKRKWPGEAEDLLSLFYLALCKAAKDYNPERGQFSTVAFKYFDTTFKTEARKLYRKRENEIPFVAVEDAVSRFTGGIDFTESVEINTILSDAIMKEFGDVAKAKKFFWLITEKPGLAMREYAKEIGTHRSLLYLYRMRLVDLLKEELGNENYTTNAGRKNRVSKSDSVSDNGNTKA